MVVQGGRRLEAGNTFGWDLTYVKNPILIKTGRERSVTLVITRWWFHKGSRVISSEIPVVKWLKIQSRVKTEWNMKKISIKCGQ